MPKGYTTLAEIQNYLLTTIDASFYTQIDSWISQVEAYIDQQTGRNFKADITDNIRKYDGNGGSKMLIDDCVSISKISIKDTEGDIINDQLVANTDYFLEPANETPKNEVRLYGYIFSRGIQNIEITGKWGFSTAVPDDIKFAATVLVSNIVNFSNQTSGEVQSLTAGKVSLSFRQQEKIDDYGKVENILDSYKKYEF